MIESKEKKMENQINIHAASAGLKLKQDIKVIANKLSKTPNSLMNEILQEALDKKDIYNEQLKNGRLKGGNHISIATDSKKSEIIMWAKEKGSNISLWSNHILEKSIELNYKHLLNS